MTQHLYAFETGEDLGPATPAQIEASDRAAKHDDGSGVFLIDAAGNVVPASLASEHDTLAVYTEDWGTQWALR